MTGVFEIEIKKGRKYFSASVFGNDDDRLELKSRVLRHNKQNSKRAEAEKCQILKIRLVKEIKI